MPHSRDAQVIVVTGASSGFGALSARALGRRGHTVYAGMRGTTSHNTQAVAELDADAAEAGCDLRAIELDVCDQRSVDRSIDRIIAEWGRHPLLFAPGTRFRYSNLNYVIAGRIAELATGEPLFALQQRRIFAPLGMTGVVDLDQVTSATPNLATGYVRTGLGPLEPASDEGPGWSFGAGQIVATASDLARWDAKLLSGRLLPAVQAVEEATPPVLASGERSPYALGLFVSRRSGRLVWSHVGQGLGFLAGNSIYPDDGTAIVVLTNTSATLGFAHPTTGEIIRHEAPLPADFEAELTSLRARR